MPNRQYSTKDMAKEAFMWIIWCCLHPFAFLVPLSFLLGSCIGELLYYLFDRKKHGD